MDIVDTGKQAIDRLSYIRVQVYWINNINIRVLTRHRPKSLANSFKTTTKTLTTVPSDQNHLSLSINERRRCSRLDPQLYILFQTFDHIQQCIDDCITGNQNTLRINAFTQQISPRGLGRREMQVGQGTGQFAICFFWPWGINISCT
ncbi:hypothetical protein D3C77_436920 [compost metagenome]